MFVLILAPRSRHHLVCIGLAWIIFVKLLTYEAPRRRKPVKEEKCQDTQTSDDPSAAVSDTHAKSRVIDVEMNRGEEEGLTCKRRFRLKKAKQKSKENLHPRGHRLRFICRLWSDLVVVFATLSTPEKVSSPKCENAFEKKTRMYVCCSGWAFSSSERGRHKMIRTGRYGRRQESVNS